MTRPLKPVLLVEDNAENRYLATVLLQGAGYAVVEAADGAAALAAVAREEFAFVLVDLQLPDIDGFEVARRIREIKTLSELPIIAVSALTMLSDRRRAMAAGCVGYIEKPIEADRFVAEAQLLAHAKTN